MIGSDLEGAGLESRAGSATSDDAAAVRAVIGADMYQQMPEQSGGGCSGILRVRHPDSGAFRIRSRSAGTTRLRLRRRLPARTGAVQVDIGVAGAVRVPALGDRKRVS